MTEQPPAQPGPPVPPGPGAASAPPPPPAAGWPGYATGYPGYAPPPPKPPLRRSKDERVIAGVCGGIGRTFGIDPVIPRIVLAVLTLFGGTGLLLYGLAWLFIPEDGAPVSAGEGFAQRNGKGVTVALAVVAGLVLLPLSIGGLWFMGEWGPWGGPGFAPLIIIGVIGVIVWFALRDRDQRPAPQPVAYGAYGQPVTGPPVATPPAYAQAGPPPTYAPQPPQPAYVPPPVPPAYAQAPVGGYGPPSYPPYAPQYVKLPPPKPPRERSILGLLTVSAAALTAGVLWLLDLSDVIDPDWVVYPAAVLGVLGLGLIIGTFVGRARWLVALGVPLVFVAVVAGQVSTWGNGEFGDPRWNPTSLAEAEGPWEHGVGEARLDLTGVIGIDSLREDLEVPVEMGIGDLRVIVPADVPLRVSAEVGLGEAEITGRGLGDDFTEGGSNVELDESFGDTTDPAIVLDIQLSVGHVEVIREAA